MYKLNNIAAPHITLPKIDPIAWCILWPLSAAIDGALAALNPVCKIIQIVTNITQLFIFLLRSLVFTVSVVLNKVMKLTEFKLPFFTTNVQPQFITALYVQSALFCQFFAMPCNNVSELLAIIINAVVFCNPVQLRQRKRVGSYMIAFKCANH